MSENGVKKFITWDPKRLSGLNWVVFQPAQKEETEGITPTGQELGEYSTYVAAKTAHPDARITNDAAEAIKYGNI